LALAQGTLLGHIADVGNHRAGMRIAEQVRECDLHRGPRAAGMQDRRLRRPHRRAPL
jgi:hypothetical protein